jgi:hypothetical protein
MQIPSVYLALTFLSPYRRPRTWWRRLWAWLP